MQLRPEMVGRPVLRMLVVTVIETIEVMETKVVTGIAPVRASSTIMEDVREKAIIAKTEATETGPTIVVVGTKSCPMCMDNTIDNRIESTKKIMAFEVQALVQICRRWQAPVRRDTHLAATRCLTRGCTVSMPSKGARTAAAYQAR